MSTSPRYTEEVQQYQIIYNEARAWQYTYGVLQAKPDDELVYLAGMIHEGHKDLSETEQTKLQGNANRARDELQRGELARRLNALVASTEQSRRLVRATWALTIVALITAVGTIVVALLA